MQFPVLWKDFQRVKNSHLDSKLKQALEPTIIVLFSTAFSFTWRPYNPCTETPVNQPKYTGKIRLTQPEFGH